jgi:hypothetical protein
MVHCFIRGPDLENGPHLHPRLFRHQSDRVVQIAGFQEQDATESFLGFRKRTIGDFDRATFHPQSDRVARGIKRFSTQEMSAPAKFIVIGEALLHHSLRVFIENLTELRLVNEP